MPHVLAHSTQLFASVTSADPLRLGEEVDRLLAAGVDAIHLDVADGVFVPDLTFGLRTVRALAEATEAPLDLHFMVERPEDVLRELAGIRPLRVAVHLEACPYPWRTLSLARSLGLTAGLALNPGTPVGALEDLGAGVAFVNLLSTEVDFAGEQLLPGSERRIAAARALLPASVRLEVDGGVSAASIAVLVRAGADDVVVGRALVGAPDAHLAIATLRGEAARGRRGRARNSA